MLETRVRKGIVLFIFLLVLPLTIGKVASPPQKEITYMTKFGGGRGSATFARCKKPIKCPKNVNKGDIICKDNNLFLCSKKNTFLRHSTCKQGTHCQNREIKLSSRVLHKAKCVADET